MIQNLERKKVKNLQEEIPTTGHRPLKVQTSDNKTYFVKNYEGKLPAYYLSSEIICYYMLTLWEIPTPEIALLQIDAKSFEEVLIKFSQRHKDLYYDLLAFGSLLIVGSVMELNSLTEPNLAVYPNNIENTEDLWKIALFDIWVENDDRKPSNPNLLLRKTENNKTKIYALDHAFCFNSLTYRELKYSFGITQGFNDNILYTDLAKNLFQKYRNDNEFKEKVKDFFTSKRNDCQKYFEDIWDNIPEEFALENIDKEKMQAFLFDEKRNQQVLEYFFEHVEDYD